jgi:membrane dipeptidase
MDPRTETLHRQAIIVDAHNDSLARMQSKGDPMDFGAVDEPYHCNTERLRQSGITALFSYVGSVDLVASLELWEALLRHPETYPETYTLARTAADIRQAKQDGKVALVGQLESLACLGNSLGALRLQHRLGLRVANLTHGEGLDRHATSLQVDSSVFDYTTAEARLDLREGMRGLTDFGREAVHACSSMGIVVDLAHANDRTFFEALELAGQPCVFSHGCVFAVCSHFRGLMDDQIRTLAANGGVMGVACYDRFIHRDAPTMDRLMDQVEHVIGLVGPDHVGLGSDYDGLPDDTVPIPPHPGRLIEFTEALAQRGFDDETILKVLGGNFLRVFEAVCG